MTNFHKMVIAAAATTMMVSHVQAAEVSALSPGKPAGVEVAQRGSPNLLVVLGVSVVVAGAIGLALALDDKGSPCGAACNPPTPSTTP